MVPIKWRLNTDLYWTTRYYMQRWYPFTPRRTARLAHTAKTHLIITHLFLSKWKNALRLTIDFSIDMSFLQICVGKAPVHTAVHGLSAVPSAVISRTCFVWSQYHLLSQSFGGKNQLVPLSQSQWDFWIGSWLNTWKLLELKGLWLSLV